MTPASQADQFLQSPIPTFFTLWIPVLFSMIAEPLTGLVDTAFVSQLGVENLAALGVGTTVLTSGLWLFNFLSVGSQTEVSQASGENDPVRGKKMGSLAIGLAACIGTLIIVFFLFFASEVAALMGAVNTIHDHAVSYITIRAYGAPAVLITMTSFGILYGLSDMKTPLFIAVTVNVLNILLDGLLIFGIGPLPEMGISGAALASTISQWVGALWCLISTYRQLGLCIHYDYPSIITFLVIGRDMFIRTGSLVLFLLLTTRFATQISSESGAAHQAIRQVWIFTNLFLDASAVAAQSLIGYSFGSGKIDQARRIARLVGLWSVVIGTALMCTMILGSSIVASLLIPPSSIAVFHSAWILSAIFQPIASVAFVTDGIHWGTGDYGYLRNCVVLATVCGVLLLFFAEKAGFSSLTVVWWITGVWIFIRSALGVIRIWPGIGSSPLRLQR